METEKVIRILEKLNADDQLDRPPFERQIGKLLEQGRILGSARVRHVFGITLPEDWFDRLKLSVQQGLLTDNRQDYYGVLGEFFDQMLATYPRLRANTEKQKDALIKRLNRLSLIRDQYKHFYRRRY